MPEQGLGPPASNLHYLDQRIVDLFPVLNRTDLFQAFQLSPQDLRLRENLDLLLTIQEGGLHPSPRILFGIELWPEVPADGLSAQLDQFSFLILFG